MITSSIFKTLSIAAVLVLSSLPGYALEHTETRQTINFSPVPNAPVSQRLKSRWMQAEYSCSNTCRNAYTICYGNSGNDQQISRCKKQFNDCMYGC